MQNKDVPAAMTIAQAAEVLATAFLAKYFLAKTGFNWVMAAGVLCWLIMYIVYAAMQK